VPNQKTVSYTGLANARPKTLAIADRVEPAVEAMSFDVREYLEFELPDSDTVGDWDN